MMRMHLDHNAPARLLCSLALLFFVFVGAPSADAQTTPTQNPPPPQVQQLLNLMQDPAVRGWIDQQQQPAPTPALAGAAADGPRDDRLRDDGGPDRRACGTILPPSPPPRRACRASSATPRIACSPSCTAAASSAC